MPINVLLADGDQTSARWLKSVLDRDEFAVEIVASAADALERIERSHPDVLVTEATLKDGDMLDTIRRLRGNSATRDLYIIILSAKGKPEDIVSGLHAGANDYIPKRPGAEADLVGKIRAHMSIRKPGMLVPQPPPGRAQIFSFCSAKGGTGTTSICINLAYALSQLEPKAQIAIVDMVLPFGTVGPFLDAELPLTIAKLTQEIAIDQSTMSQYVSKKEPWHLDFLLGATTPQEAAEINVSKLPKIFSTLREMYDYILIDFGRGLSRISLPIIESATGIVILASSDVNTVRATRPLIEYLEMRGVTTDRMFIINNRTAGRMWMTSEEIEKAIGMKPHASIPYTVESMTLAINESTPFLSKFPQHAASTAITDIARTLQTKFRKS